jgi:hypothetical protein
MAFTCDSCHKRFREGSHKTATGRAVCTACRDQILGSAAGVMAAGGIGGGIATAGWFARIKASRKRRA